MIIEAEQQNEYSGTRKLKTEIRKIRTSLKFEFDHFKDSISSAKE